MKMNTWRAGRPALLTVARSSPAVALRSGAPRRRSALDADDLDGREPQRRP